MKRFVVRLDYLVEAEDASDAWDKARRIQDEISGLGKDVLIQGIVEEDWRHPSERESDIPILNQEAPNPLPKQYLVSNGAAFWPSPDDFKRSRLMYAGLRPSDRGDVVDWNTTGEVEVGEYHQQVVMCFLLRNLFEKQDRFSKLADFGLPESL